MTKETNTTEMIAYSLTQGERRIFSICPKCGQVLAEGTWALDGEMRGVHFLIGPSPRPTCCGEERQVPFLFETPVAAQDKMHQVCSEIERRKSHLVYNYYGRDSFIPKYLH